MGQKTQPIGFRLGVNRTWDSRWFGGKSYGELLHQDIQLRKYLFEKLKAAAISKIIIERPAGRARISIYAGRPGLVIGKKGQDIETLKIELSKKIKETIPIHQNGGLDILHELSTRILESIKYSKGKTDINTTAEIAMEIGAGVCQDHTHAFITSARLLGFSSRYVSGYLSNGMNESQVATHAWAEVYIMGLGWFGFDISNGISPDERYVRLATGFDYADVIPISGVRIGNGEEQIKTEITFNQQ